MLKHIFIQIIYIYTYGAMYIYLFKILISYNYDDPTSETLLCLYVFLLCLKY